MNLIFTPALAKLFRAADLDHPAIPNKSYGDTSVPIDVFEDKYLDRVAEWAKQDSTTYNGLLQKLSMWKNAKLKGDTITPKVLSQLEATIHAQMLKLPHRLMFTMREVSEPVIYINSVYTPAKKDTPADVDVFFKYYTKGSVETIRITFYQDDVTGNAKTVLEMLASCKVPLTVETPELMVEYEARVADYLEKRDSLQYQFLYTTSRLPEIDGTPKSHRSAERARSGAATYRMVNDDNVAKVSDAPVLRLPGVRTKSATDDYGDQIDGMEDEDDTAIYHLPLWPRVYCYNLEVHGYMWVEPWLLEHYVYDTNLVNKLIIPAEHKDLLRLLTENPDTLVADIVSGKSGGTFIISCGAPGLGKTLAAEAFSEGTKRILYRVQSDQLGMEADEIERSLKDIFIRAERWDAVLLLDEADIYVRKRGYDINQNAIVGTILRMIEYFNGTMFATTNLGSDIDDAIVSRASAVMVFSYPTLEDSRVIFDQFAKLFGMTIPAGLRDEWLAPGGNLIKRSGRSLKNILRLAARRGMLTPSLADLNSSASFIFDASASRSSDDV